MHRVSKILRRFQKVLHRMQKIRTEKALAPQSYDNSTAKITALRVDDRLIHGQVAMTWTKQLAVQGNRGS